MSDDPEVRSSAAPAGDAGALDFLAGGGELGERMRALDWGATPLGDPRHWPGSLRTTVGILLNSRYPMFLAWGPELAFLYNDGYRPVFGDKHPAALGRPFAQIWPEIWGDIRPLVDRALAGEPTWSENMQLFMERRGFTEESYFTFSYSPVRGDDGAIQGLFCACTETTGDVIGERRMKLLRDLAAATGEARSVAEVCRVAAEVIGANAADVPFALIYLRDPAADSARLLACSGCAAGEPFSPQRVTITGNAPGWPHQPMLPDRDSVLRGLDPALGLSGGPWPEAATSAAILPLARPGHDPVRGHLIAGTSPRLEFDERYAQFLDLLAGGLASALANAEAHEAEHQRAEALAEIDRAKSVFFSNLSHEFRTPLTLILAPLIEVLAPDRGVPAPLREQLSVAHRNALRLLKLVNSLLDFSRIEAGRAQACFQATELGALTEDLASNFRAACEQAGLSLRVDCATLPEPVYVDPDMWERIVLNLLSNAFKFTLQGSIDVTLRAVDRAAVLQVRDTGSGIPADELPRLFERFHRVEGTRARSHEGSGIGLALVWELVKQHGGRVEVESEPGRGTCLSVTVPFGVAHLPEQQLGARRAAATPGTLAAAYVEEALRWLPDAAALPAGTNDLPHSDGAFPGSGQARVLVADDNADMRDYLARLLRAHWRVETAADGAQALQAARREPPDLLLTDVMMPGLDGFALIRALRAHEPTAAVPVIMLSARAGEESRLEGLQAGVDDYLVKPFSARELVARVASQLAWARGERERAALIEREREARRTAELEKQHLDEFLAMLSHELRNPLAPIMTALELMRLRGDSSFERERAIIERQAMQLVGLVDDLMDISRITRGKVTLKPKPIEIAEVVARAIEMVSPLLEQRRHTLVTDVAPRGLMVSGDAARLAQVVSNLLSNAAKYTDPEGRISIAAQHAGESVVLTVRDNGSGIGADLLPRVFEMFAQQRDDGDRSHGGLGLGLCIVRSIVALHGGEVSAHSDGPDCGSEFTVRLPALAAPPALAQDPARPAAAPTRAAAARRVLIVDDNEDAARTLATYLEGLGHQVRVAYDGAGALRLAAQFAPDAVLLDLGLPVMDGYEVARRLREQSGAHRMCLIAVTGYGQHSERARTESAGFDTHLAKPVDLPGLSALLDELEPAGGGS